MKRIFDRLASIFERKRNGYEIEFGRANQRRRMAGLQPFSIPQTRQRFLPDDDAGALNRAIANVTSCYSADEVAFQCLAFHLRLIDPIRQFLRVEPILTLGFIRIGSEPLFRFTEKDLKRWCSKGVPNSELVNLHAWLTLPSMEILDYSLGASVFAINRDPRFVGGMTAMHYSGLRGMSYHPMILGSDVVVHIGAVRFEPSP